MTKSLVIILVVLIFSSCSKKEPVYEPTSKSEGYAVYQEAFEALGKGDLFFAQKKLLFLLIQYLTFFFYLRH